MSGLDRELVEHQLPMKEGFKLFKNLREEWLLRWF